MEWLKKRRIARLEVKLAGAVAADRTRREIARISQQVTPIDMENLAREVAELSEKIKQLRSQA